MLVNIQSLSGGEDDTEKASCVACGDGLGGSSQHALEATRGQVWEEEQQELPLPIYIHA